MAYEIVTIFGMFGSVSSKKNLKKNYLGDVQGIPALHTPTPAFHQRSTLRLNKRSKLNLGFIIFTPRSSLILIQRSTLRNIPRIAPGQYCYSKSEISPYKYGRHYQKSGSKANKKRLFPAHRVTKINLIRAAAILFWKIRRGNYSRKFMPYWHNMVVVIIFTLP